MKHSHFLALLNQFLHQYTLFGATIPMAVFGLYFYKQLVEERVGVCISDLHFADSQRQTETDRLDDECGVTLTECFKGRKVLLAFEQQHLASVGVLKQQVGMPLVAEQVHVLFLVQIIDVFEAVSAGDILALLVVGGS